MPAKLYIVHGSHPCRTAEKAFALKGVPVKKVEIPPPGHFVVMKRMFEGRTVPAVRFEDGEKVQGSSRIMRALDRRVAEPRLYTSAEVEAAERWGEEELQPIPRRLLWVALSRHGEAMYGFQEGQAGPKLPLPVVRAAAPLVTRIERRINAATDESARGDLQALPGHLDRVDRWIADGVLGGDEPNAADLQIAPSIALLATLGDVRPLIAGRPAEDLARRWFDPAAGDVPAGTLPAEWLPPRSATAPA